jgi:hypothetical protein
MKFPIEICVTLGYSLACTASAIAVTNILRANEEGYGKAKGIGSSTIAAVSFDNIHCIIAFGVACTIAESNSAVASGLPAS